MFRPALNHYILGLFFLMQAVPIGFQQLWYSSLTELINFKNYLRGSPQNVDTRSRKRWYFCTASEILLLAAPGLFKWHTHVITAYFMSGKINAFILVILFDNLIDGMIIAVVIAELKSSFKLTITTAMIVFAFRFLYFRNSNHHLH